MNLADKIIAASNSREEALAKLWDERKASDGKDNELFEKLEEVEKAIKEIPVVTLSVALDLFQTEKDDLEPKLRNVFGKKVFLEIRTNPSLIAGCLFIWQGRVYDYSLKKTMTDKKAEFRKIVTPALN